MNVIRHEAIGYYFNSLPSCVLAKQLEVSNAIAAAEEHPFAMIAALCDVMWDTWKYDPGMSWHAQKVAAPRGFVGSLNR
jgi:hypothetical protein